MTHLLGFKSGREMADGVEETGELGSAGNARIGDQVLRSGMSVAANDRAAGRSRSRAELVAKLSIAIEEADETVFWLELLVDSGIVPATRLMSLTKEAEEIRAILVASQRTARAPRI